MELNLTEKVAVVTGGSKGIGLAVAEAFGREGARVVVGSRTETPELAALRERFDVAFHPVDLADADAADALIQEAAARHGRIDVLVNNVGATSPRSSFLDVDDAAWERALNMTFLSAVRASRASLPHLLAHGEGSIVNISSINARLPFPMVVDYSAAKAALSNLTKALSEEFAPRGVRVNAVAPGPVRTPFWTAPAPSPIPSRPARAVRRRRPWTRSCPSRWASPPGGSPNPRRWPTLLSSWPLRVPATSPVPNSSLMEARSRPPDTGSGEPGQLTPSTAEAGPATWSPRRSARRGGRDPAGFCTSDREGRRRRIAAHEPSAPTAQVVDEPFYMLEACLRRDLP